MDGTRRIPTTHAGSLPRPPEIIGMLQTPAGKCSEDAYSARLQPSVIDAVESQLKHGLDIVNDGEWSKPSFVAYIYDRLSGFEPQPGPCGEPWWAESKETASFPEYYESVAPSAARRGHEAPQMVCTGPVTYVGDDRLRRDLDNLSVALGRCGGGEAFVTATSPTNVEDCQRNEYYATQEEYLFAIADALHEEYTSITEAGFYLQIDDPQLVTHYTMTADESVEAYRRWAELRVEALNHALRGIPAERIRLHTCYGIDSGPRVHDMELRQVVDLLLKVQAGAYSVEAANPRHEHEWRVWEDVSLPVGKKVIPGVVTHCSPLVEHPELVAQRLVRFAAVVGKDNIIAGADCGFATVAATTNMDPRTAWAKLSSLVEGARLASDSLWGSRGGASGT